MVRFIKSAVPRAHAGLGANVANKCTLHRLVAPPLPTMLRDHDRAVDCISVVVDAAGACQTAGTLGRARTRDRTFDEAPHLPLCRYNSAIVARLGRRIPGIWSGCGRRNGKEHKLLLGGDKCCAHFSDAAQRELVVGIVYHMQFSESPLFGLCGLESLQFLK